MKLKKITASGLLILTIIGSVAGCKNEQADGRDNRASADNILITETGDVVEKPTPKPIPESSEQDLVNENTQAKKTEEPAAAPIVELDVPVQEQSITEEDQVEPQGKGLQLVFLGDSIFDNNRDGTGIPFLTADQCDADVFNLAIGGTSASLESGEDADLAEWTSRSLCGVVNAMQGKIPTGVFEGTRAKELLDNPNIDFSQTDYFIVEYGTNDFFRAVRQNDLDMMFNLHTYGGALRYGVAILQELAPDATIILCSPCYAQFFHDGFMIGDGNVLNSGNGTLFDYKGTCNYIANEMQVEFFNAYQDLGINGYTAEEYLEDGVHLTEAGRRLYAEELAKRILNFEKTKNN